MVIKPTVRRCALRAFHEGPHLWITTRRLGQFGECRTLAPGDEMIWVLYVYKDDVLHDVMSPSRDDRECQDYVLLHCTHQYMGHGFTWRIKAEPAEYNTADVLFDVTGARS